MSPRAAAIIETMRSCFSAMEKLDGHEVDAIVVAVTGHLRAIRPEQVSPLGVLPAPTEAIRDPRNP